MINEPSTSENKKARRLQMSSSLPETDLRNGSADETSNYQSSASVKPRRRSVSSVGSERQANEKWSKPKSSATSTQNSESTSKNMLHSGRPSGYSQSNGHPGEFWHIWCS